MKGSCLRTSELLEEGGEALFGGGDVELIEGDILERREIRSDALEALGEDFRVVSNLPYSAATPFLAAMARLPAPPEEMLVTVQLEVARRLAASPGEAAPGHPPWPNCPACRCRRPDPPAAGSPRRRLRP